MTEQVHDETCELGLVRLKAVAVVERVLPLIARDDVFARTPHAALAMRLHIAQLARELALWNEAARRNAYGHISAREFQLACQAYRHFAQVFFATAATLNLAIERCDEPIRSELAELLDTGLAVLGSLGALEPKAEQTGHTQGLVGSLLAERRPS
jgi:hypothetical protein